MKKKSLIIYLVVLLIMVLGIAISVYFLYRDVSHDGFFASNDTSTEEMLADSLLTEPGDSTQHETHLVENLKQEDNLEAKQTSFEVKNSATGKMNIFEQLDDNSLMLIDENGKISWQVAFNESICGRVSTIDYYANGRLQFLFAAGSKIYLYDRLGRVVSGFPVDLKSDIELGPDAYDFNGNKRYNIMVLHKDNTIHMYNMRGQKPNPWKGIAPKESIIAMPERLKKNNNSNWVVYTQKQTLIYPFYGGEPIKELKGKIELENINL